MGKSKQGGLARLPKEQKSHFLIGPVSSWFMPSTTSIWTQPASTNKIFSENDSIKMDCDGGQDLRTSYFCYGSIGCFCYGLVYCRSSAEESDSSDAISASVSQLVDVKDDSSRVACVRFLHNSLYPIVMILTENGTLLIHDCTLGENFVLFKKNELLTKYAGVNNNCEVSASEHSHKKTRFNVTQQINSCAWVDSRNAFLAISLLKEKDYFLLWMQFKQCFEQRNNINSTTKGDWVEKHQRINLDLPRHSSSICLLEAKKIHEHHCLIAVAMDDGLIITIYLNLNEGTTKRNIKLARHSDQICSMSLVNSNPKKFPLGLLASVSRDGLVLIWDIENEFYFADYQALIDDNKKTRINWFALNFMTFDGSKNIFLAVSNSDSGLTLLELPENARSKVRLKDNRDKAKRNNDATLRHNALIFNVAYDDESQLTVTSSLDGSFIFWKARSTTTKNAYELTPKYLYPAMMNNSRSHMLRFNPINDDLLCLALGKAGVKFFKIAEKLNDCRFDMNPSCALIYRRITKANLTVTSVAWSPNHEYRLALGTLEGKVIRVDITPKRATMVEATHLDVPVDRTDRDTSALADYVLDVEFQPLERDKVQAKSHGDKQLKTDAIYSLTWGPNPASPHDISKHAIYAVANISHRLYIYYSSKDNSDKINNYLDEFLDQSLPEAIGEASEVAWKSTMDMMALGTTHGSIIIVTYLEDSHVDRSQSKLFKRLAIIQGPMGNSYIQCLVWHPAPDKTDPRYYFLVASSSESPAFVFNLKESVLIADVKVQLKLENNGQNADEKASFQESLSVLPVYVHKLDAHKGPITDIAWSPHEPLQLATVSFDRQCYIWSLENSMMDAQIVSKFSARDRLFSVEWSLVDSDMILTSGHDSTIWVWRPSQNRVKV